MALYHYNLSITLDVEAEVELDPGKVSFWRRDLIKHGYRSAQWFIPTDAISASVTATIFDVEEVTA